MTAVVLAGCANRGMQAPGDPDGTGGMQATGGAGSGGTPATGTGGNGTGGTPIGTGGRGGSGGAPTGTGGVIGTGGVVATGGVVGTGGMAAIGGTTGTGGKATGGTIGTGGVAGAGGKGGGGGTVATGGVIGTGGVVGTGGMAGARGGAAGSMTGTGGMAGAAGGGGKGANVCTGGGVLDCSTAGAMTLPSGAVTSFSAAEWNATSAQFCDADGLRGRLFSYAGTATGSAAATTVDTTAQALKLSVTSKDWAGGGVIFESCTNVSGFTSLSFTATVTAGSLSGCTWQVQLQTQDQRSTADTDPTGGTCASNCYRYPAAPALAVPATNGTTYTEPFSMFNNPASSTIRTATQVVGVQWQVTSSSTNGCTAELRIDDIKFQ